MLLLPPGLSKKLHTLTQEAVRAWALRTNYQLEVVNYIATRKAQITPAEVNTDCYNKCVIGFIMCDLIIQGSRLVIFCFHFIMARSFEDSILLPGLDIVLFFG